MKDGKIDFFKTQWGKYTLDTLGYREIHNYPYMCYINVTLVYMLHIYLLHIFATCMIYKYTCMH